MLTKWLQKLRLIKLKGTVLMFDNDMVKWLLLVYVAIGTVTIICGWELGKWIYRAVTG